MGDVWRCDGCGNHNPESGSTCLRCGAEPGGSSRVAVGRRVFLGPEEWEALRTAPLATFFYVSGVDRNLDEGEQKAMVATLAGAQLFDSFLLREACGQLARELDDSDLERPPEEIDEEEFDRALRRVARVLDERLDEEEATAFRRGLVDLARIVAQATGGGLFGGGGRISRVEAEAIETIGDALDYREEAPAP